MGFSLRNTRGLLRFNVSDRGVGMSIGGRGFRVGTGSRGNYVSVGFGGIRYRQTIPSMPVRGSSGPDVSGLAIVDSASAEAIVDATPDHLLEELREKRRKVAFTPAAIIGAVAIAILSANTGSWWVVGLALLAGVFLVAVAQRRDVNVQTTFISYDLDPAAAAAHEHFLACAAQLAACSRVREGRGLTFARIQPPKRVVTNVPVFCIAAGRQTLYFLPDRLLITDALGIGAVTYRNLEITAAAARCVEHDGVPPAAAVVDRTWTHVTKNGLPDRRYKFNPEIPVCLYDELLLRTPSGLHERIQFSRSGVAAPFAAAVHALARSV